MSASFPRKFPSGSMWRSLSRYNISELFVAHSIPVTTTEAADNFSADRSPQRKCNMTGSSRASTVTAEQIRLVL